jgi:L-seryl-tRNA(Ser) seleniumtransferase
MTTQKTIGQIPQVERLLQHPLLLLQQNEMRRDLLVVLIRQHLNKLRQRLKDGHELPQLDEIAVEIDQAAQQLHQPYLKPVINGTGVILSTNLGRAPLSRQISSYVAKIASSYCNLEIDLDSGKRGQRTSRIEALLKILTGCPAALVVNNNAAAVMLAVNTLSSGKDTIVSRGEQIEIGGSFRLPEVVTAAGATLKEVGTTNRTRIADYQSALGPNSGLLLKCHRSNFEITGFTEEVTYLQLVELSKKCGIPFLYDAGSGMLIESLPAPLAAEETIQSLMQTEGSLVSFSGDKLLGGPQAGIILGSAEVIQRLHGNPFYRAVRADKLTLAALEATLCAYLSPDAGERITTITLNAVDGEILKSRAETFAGRANRVLNDIKCETVEAQSTAGGGSLPGTTYGSYGVALTSSISAQQLCRHLRTQDYPVIGIIQNQKILLDFRTIFPEEEDLLLKCLTKIESTQLKRI